MPEAGETAKYPAALPTLADFGAPVDNFARLTLSGAHNASTTSIIVNESIPATWPQAGWLTIEGEILRFTAWAVKTFTVATRDGSVANNQGTTPASHPDAIRVGRYLTEQAFNQIVAEIISLRTLLGIKFNQQGTTIASGSSAVNTTIAASISTGSQTVTPASMTSIAVGMALRIDVSHAPGSSETVVVTAVGGSTFTAVFANAHTGPGIDVVGAQLDVVAGGSYVHVSGTTNLTALAVMAAGAVRVLEFEGILTLFTGSQLVIRSGQNVVTAAGDIYTFISEGAGVWREISHLIGGSTSADVQIITASGNWTKPAGAKSVEVLVWGAGGGGGGGRGGAAASNRIGGGGGGGGAFNRRVFPASILGATEVVTVGAAGTSGAGGSSADGVDGGTGGTTSFGTAATLVKAFGGGGGRKGTSASQIADGGGGGGTLGAGGIISGGKPQFAAYGDGHNAMAGGGATASNSGNGTPTNGCGEQGGGGGGGWSAAPAMRPGGSSMFGGAGGGLGGYVDGGNTQNLGTAGGASGSYTEGGGAAAGAVGANPGVAGAGGAGIGGSGGGGGGANSGGTGGAGGAGGAAGGGGGGGGGGTSIGGAGGLGGRGEIIVITSF